MPRSSGWNNEVVRNPPRATITKPHKPLEGQRSLFGDDERAAAYRELADDTAREDK
ncbi:MAG: hypothetical protein ABGZ17_20980 [Planctomycetaceae bacterium]